METHIHSRNKTTYTLVLYLAIVLLFFINSTELLAQNTGVQTDNNLILLEAVAPKYPAFAITARVSGTVRTKVTINQQGEVVSIEDLRGHKLLQKAVEDCVKQWKFRNKGTNDATIIDIVFNFVLMPENTPSKETLTTFRMPYTVEVKDIVPKIIQGNNVDPPFKQRTSKKKKLHR